MRQDCQQVAVLARSDRRIARVVYNKKLDGQVKGCNSGELLDIELKTSVAVYRYGLPAPGSHAAADGGGYGKTHGSSASVVKAALTLLDFQHEQKYLWGKSAAARDDKSIFRYFVRQYR